MAERFPIFITVRDRVTPLRDLIDWLERSGQDEIWLVDNASTYPPLLEYLDASPHQVLRLEHNLGHRAPWLCGAIQRNARGRFFVVSDPDVVPDEACPLDALQVFRRLFKRHQVDKVGFGLRIDDLPNHFPLREDVQQWEGRFWREEVEPGVFHAEIDTTFAMYRPPTRDAGERALRTGTPYVARHTPWYVDPAALTDEDRYYREHADPTISNWDREELPAWKRRWLNNFAELDRLAATEAGGHQ